MAVTALAHDGVAIAAGAAADLVVQVVEIDQVLGVQMRVGVGGNRHVVSLLSLHLARHDGRQLQVGHAIHAYFDTGHGAELFELPLQFRVRSRHEVGPDQQFEFPLLRHQGGRLGQQHAGEAGCGCRRDTQKRPPFEGIVIGSDRM